MKSPNSHKRDSISLLMTSFTSFIFVIKIFTSLFILTLLTILFAFYSPLIINRIAFIAVKITFISEKRSLRRLSSIK